MQDLITRLVFDLTAMPVFGLDPDRLSTDMPPMHVAAHKCKSLSTGLSHGGGLFPAHSADGLLEGDEMAKVRSREEARSAAHGATRIRHGDVRDDEGHPCR